MRKILQNPRAKSFIKGEEPQEDSQESQKKKIITISIDPTLLGRIDKTAKGIGISRAAFFTLSAGDKLKEYE